MKRLSWLIFTVVFMLLLAIVANAEYNIDTVISDSAEYLLENVSSPAVGSVGGEWTVIGLKRSGLDIENEYFDGYYDRVCAYVKEKNGVLHERKYTEYSRVILALTALGKDARDVSGCDLTAPLSDFDKTVYQGINGAIWALIALDSGGYEGTEIRERYVEHILSLQLDDGGWSLLGKDGADVSDIDITAMALQALAPYREDKRVSAAVDKALECMSKRQLESGGFESFSSVNSESSSQMLVALCTLGISVDDKRFVKNGNTVADDIMSYYTGEGFMHVKDGKPDLMATEQCFYALVAYKRAQNGESALYDMSDVICPGETGVPHEPSAVLPEKKSAAQTIAELAGMVYKMMLSVLVP
ncbi:MAG: terpene cyclase/mutase family protein [Clostridia bacterium]|nr:terpene cyclase/mutase family protein [Clostridia bacterium]